MGPRPEDEPGGWCPQVPRLPVWWHEKGNEGVGGRAVRGLSDWTPADTASTKGGQCHFMRKIRCVNFQVTNRWKWPMLIIFATFLCKYC